MLTAGGGEELKILLDTSVLLGFGLGDCGLPLHVLEFSLRDAVRSQPHWCTVPPSPPLHPHLLE